MGRYIGGPFPQSRISMTPLEKYRADLARADFVHDPAQEQAMLALEDLYQRLVAVHHSAGLLARLRRRGKTEPEKGLYMWGGVGRGKTYMMDVFLPACRLKRSGACTFTASCRRCICVCGHCRVKRTR